MNTDISEILTKLNEKFKQYRNKFIDRALLYDFYKKDKLINEIKYKLNQDTQRSDNISNTSFGLIIDKNNNIIDQLETLSIINYIDDNNKTTLIGTVSFDVFTQPRDYKNNKFYICDTKENYVSTNLVDNERYDPNNE
jgi:hypothetical protein